MFPLIKYTNIDNGVPVFVNQIVTNYFKDIFILYVIFKIVPSSMIVFIIFALPEGPVVGSLPCVRIKFGSFLRVRHASCGWSRPRADHRHLLRSCENRCWRVVILKVRCAAVTYLLSVQLIVVVSQLGRPINFPSCTTELIGRRRLRFNVSSSLPRWTLNSSWYLAEIFIPGVQCWPSGGAKAERRMCKDPQNY